MRIPAITSPEESNSMSAMTDVVFLLLIFFIVTMSSYVEMSLLETHLPTSGGTASRVNLQNTLKIGLSASGSYVVNGVQQSRETLGRLLRRYSRLMPDAEFLLQCDPDSKHHMLVTLLSDLAKNNLRNVKLLK